ncbi:S-adenosyl-L-methionine-dependent methyltransferase [Phaeosphaeria sp. MPI-PUGE-AT-0046c]|nr:S-adenosyl-L-methionine-dependent methyltransferase [Phaeosphaeria sp. MPI-PUGE-AT-0046c]
MRHHVLHRLLYSAPSRQAAAKHFSTSRCRRRAFREGDVVLLRDKRDTSQDGMLVKLQAAHSVHSHRGVINHADLIGKEPRQLVRSSKGTLYRIHEPTLAEYVRLTPRIVTPIYPADANLIVSQLDIHVDTPSEPLRTEPPLEILEAGTGHGALTLHLARAVHAANSPRPRPPPIVQQDEPEDAVYLGESMADLDQTAAATWRDNRRAIVHTLDISGTHSKHAKKIVGGFRGGIYSGNVDFHVGDVSEWLSDQRAKRQTEEPFLSHVLLDLPNADHHLPNVAQALHVNGMLAVFNPSITQIVDCVAAVREQKMPYLLDKVIELGAGTIREWDVRAVKPRASVNKAKVQESVEGSDGGAVDPVEEQKARDDELAKDLSQAEEKWATVCRPKAGQQVVGGGFLGLWRRMEPRSSQETDPSTL